MEWRSRKFRPNSKRQIENPPEVCLGFEPDPIQRRLLESTSSQVILNCTRQWGKSTITAAKAVLQAHGEPGSLILVVSPCERQSEEFIQKAEAALRAMRQPFKKARGHRTSVELNNGSRIVGLPSNEAGTRGFSSARLLVVDEAARVADELYLSLRPVLAVSGGSVWLMSTPFGKRGFFYNTWMHGGPEWERIQVTAEQCPRIRPEFLAREREMMGEAWFRQEYQCEFSDVNSSVFSRDLIEAAIDDEIRPLNL